MIRSLDLHGNAYARIERNSRGQVTALYPLLPISVAPERLPSGRLRYRVTDSRGAVSVLLSDEILHVRGPSKDGVLGLSPIAIAREALALPIAQAQTAAALMSNSLRPSGVLVYPERLNAEQKTQIRAPLERQFTGEANSGKVLIMDGGARFEKLAFSPEDAEFLESRKLANEDTARVFGVPPTTVGILDKGTYSNVEQESQALIQNCLGPLAARVETAMMRCLLTDVGRRSLYIEHDLNSLLRGDVKSRFEAYRVAREIGAFSANDVRRRENEPPIKDGDTYHQPANWIALGATPPERAV
jgi:HK97 family phage portal protein